jgi:hypothetical protein
VDEWGKNIWCTSQQFAQYTEQYLEVCISFRDIVPGAERSSDRYLPVRSSVDALPASYPSLLTDTPAAGLQVSAVWHNCPCWVLDGVHHVGDFTGEHFLGCVNPYCRSAQKDS